MCRRLDHYVRPARRNASAVRLLRELNRVEERDGWSMIARQEEEVPMHRCWIPRFLLVTTVLAGFLMLRSPLVAQAPPSSQHGSVSQQIAGTRVTIEYNRPVARGRVLFGALVPWGRVWNPGANTATTITLSTSLQVNGQALAAGTYSLWAEPQPERWTYIFSRAHPVWHTPYPAGQDELRVPAISRTGAQMETLTFYFPVVDGRHAELVLHWGTLVVPLQLEVP